MIYGSHIALFFPGKSKNLQKRAGVQGCSPKKCFLNATFAEAMRSLAGGPTADPVVPPDPHLWVIDFVRRQPMIEGSLGFPRPLQLIAAGP
jgi:hypothetical protein